MATVNVGDQVKLVGTVKELVTDKATGRVSALLGTLDQPGNPSHEYWAGADDLVADTPEAPAAESASTSGGKTAAKPAAHSHA